MEIKIVTTFVVCIVLLAVILVVACRPKKDDRLFPIEVKGQMGYIDKTGKVVIEPQFDNAELEWFSEGLALVMIGDHKDTEKVDQYGRIPSINHKYGYIDMTGKIVIPPQFDHARPFSEGLAGVETAGKNGYIDKTGVMIIEPQVDGSINFLRVWHAQGLAISGVILIRQAR